MVLTTVMTWSEEGFTLFPVVVSGIIGVIDVDLWPKLLEDAAMAPSP